MANALERRLSQMLEAFGEIKNPDIEGVEDQRGYTPEGKRFVKWDAGYGYSEEGLANAASLIIAKIASLKDHFKIWCRNNHRNFDGDTLINSDKDIAIVHDLWNADKHGELTHSRSGHYPWLDTLSRHVEMTTGDQAGSSAGFTLDSVTGTPKAILSPGGSANIVITGKVLDKSGRTIGDFAQICQRAAASWEDHLRKAGVAIPSR